MLARGGTCTVDFPDHSPRSYGVTSDGKHEPDRGQQVWMAAGSVSDKTAEGNVGTSAAIHKCQWLALTPIRSEAHDKGRPS